MKYTLLLCINLFVFSLFSQTQPNHVPFKKQESKHIKEILKAWDNEKGIYLYNSISALVMHQPQPKRTEGVNQTPFELLQGMDIDRIQRLVRVANTELENEKAAKRGKRTAYYWQNWIKYLETTTCGMQRGSSTGEPHMLTFDGERYDFQNAGDYLLSSSDDQTFLIQTQLFRRYTNDSWSLNGGVVMNVNGDIVELKGTAKPIDGEVYINKKLITERNTTINLPQGGTIRLNEVPKSNKNRHIRGDRFIIKWPTGEQMRVAIIRNFSFGDKKENQEMNILYQLYVEVPQCKKSYTGLLGNNDGIKNDLIVDDTTTINNDRSTLSEEELFGNKRHAPEVISQRERSCLYIAHPFANTFQLDEKTSLFSEQMTAIPDSVRYPSKCVTLANASDEQIAEGLRKSKEAGIRRDEMYSTVFDYAYANIEPEDQVDGTASEGTQRLNDNNTPVLNENKTPDVEKGKEESNTESNKQIEIFPNNDVESKPNNRNTRSRPYIRQEPTKSRPEGRRGSNSQSTRKPTGRR